jgi:ABC-type transporter Mla MlaB component
MLRIAETGTATQGATLQLEGQLIGPWVDELRRACENLLGRGGGLSLDLARVSFVDRAGVELLLGLQRRRVALLHCSRFVREQLGTPGASCDARGKPSPQDAPSRP